jgi:hypothetical protein
MLYDINNNVSRHPLVLRVIPVLPPRGDTSTHRDRIGAATSANVLN